MGVTKLVCDGYDDLVKRIGGLSGQKVFILFTGNKLPETGKSWCPDCVAAEPNVNEALKEVQADITFITCNVGGRDYWKDKSNPFRTDERFLVNCVPTLIELNSSGRRLVKDEEFVSVSIIVKFLS